MKTPIARVHPGVVLLLLTTAAAPSKSCSGLGAAGDAGAEGGAPPDGGVPDASVADAPSGITVSDARAEADRPSSQDGESEAVATSTLDAAQEAGVGPTAADAGDSVALGPVWASWPMPNPPSSGLPNPQSYDASVTGIVKDKVTGLMWQQTDMLATNYPTLQDAAAHCAGLALGGYSDWRLPSRIELWSIDDTSRSSPAIDPSFSTVAGNVLAGSVAAAPWTTSPGHGSYAYPGETLLLAQGDQSVSSITGGAMEGGGSVRCVRGSAAQPSPHYTVQDGTVHDNGTQLTWQQGYSSTQMLPNGVASYCTGLSLSGVVGGRRASRSSRRSWTTRSLPRLWIRPSSRYRRSWMAAPSTGPSTARPSWWASRTPRHEPSPSSTAATGPAPTTWASSMPRSP